MVFQRPVFERNFNGWEPGDCPAICNKHEQVCIALQLRLDRDFAVST
jgi:hypothetical protein